jgi:intraflagellar transport protein 88
MFASSPTFGSNAVAADDSEHDALYSGFGNVNSTIIHTVVAGANAGAGTVAGNRLGSTGPAIPGTAARMGTAARPMTGVTGSEVPRPSTSIRAAGFQRTFDPMKQASHAPAPPLKQRSDDSPEFAARDMERQVNELLLQSATLSARRQYPEALEIAKDAAKRERVLFRHRNKHGLMEAMNVDITQAVAFNLARQYANNGMNAKAIKAYSVVVKSKQTLYPDRLKVNMGNLFFSQQKYSDAIRMYRMAVDSVSGMKHMRLRILRNIGISFVQLGQYQEAIQTFESIIETSSDAASLFNLILCYYARGDKEKMKTAFRRLMRVRLPPDEHSQQAQDQDDIKSRTKKTGMADRAASIHAAMMRRRDKLKMYLSRRRNQHEKYLRQAAKLIAPVIEKDFADGFNWVVRQLKGVSGDEEEDMDLTEKEFVFPNLAMEIEIAKGVGYLRRRQIDQAIKVFRSFEKSDSKLIDQAATNLSFLYFLEGDYQNAEKHADVAIRADRYNARALVNKANVLFVSGKLEAAKDLFLEAIGVEADCTEAIYNLGLVNKRLDAFEDALRAFKKLHRIIPKDSRVVYHLADVSTRLGDVTQAHQWFKILHGLVPTDPKVLSRIGALYQVEDETQAFHNYSDAYQCYPVDLEVISWLGVYHAKSGMFEKAVEYFQHASQVQPAEVKWKLLVAGCYRRMQSYSQALDLYRAVYKKDPKNIECLKYLVSLSKDYVDTAEYEQYCRDLSKAQRELELNQSDTYGSDAVDSSSHGADSESQQPNIPTYNPNAYDNEPDGNMYSDGTPVGLEMPRPALAQGAYDQEQVNMPPSLPRQASLPAGHIPPQQELAGSNEHVPVAQSRLNASLQQDINPNADVLHTTATQSSTKADVVSWEDDNFVGLMDE